MKKSLSTYEAADLLRNDLNANWSSAGAFALVEYLEELEDSTGEEMEIDVVAIRCDFSEYSSLLEWAEEYFADETQARDSMGIDLETPMDEAEDEIRDYIQDRGTLIEFDGGVIVSSF